MLTVPLSGLNDLSGKFPATQFASCSAYFTFVDALVG